MLSFPVQLVQNKFDIPPQSSRLLLEFLDSLPCPSSRPRSGAPGHPAERRPRRPVPRQGRRRRPPPRRRPRPRRCAPMRGLCVGARVCVCIVFRTPCMFEHVPFRRFHLMFPSPPACVLCRFHGPRRKPGPWETSALIRSLHMQGCLTLRFFCRPRLLRPPSTPLGPL